MSSTILKPLVKRELRGYFATPLGYVFLIIFLFALGYATFEPGRGSFFQLRQADLRPFFQFIPWLFVFLVPAVSMRLWAEERRMGTIELLLTLPLTVRQAVLGKFLASWLFLGLALLGTFPMVLTVFYLGAPDPLVIVSGYLGSFLIAGVFLSIGCFFSALSKNQVVSFILAVAFSYLFLMAGSPPVLEFFSSFLPHYLVEVLESLSLLYHFEGLSSGILRLSSLWFSLVLISCWLYGCELILKLKKAE